MNSNWSYSPETHSLVQIQQFFVPCDLEIWWMTLKNKRTPRLYHVKLCASFQSHYWIQTGVTVWKRPMRVKSVIFLSPVTMKFDGWPRKTTENLFFTTLSFVQHFKALIEFTLELQSGNAQFESKLVIFCPVWPWNLTDDLQNTIGHLFYAASSFGYHFIAIIEFTLELQSGNS